MSYILNRPLVYAHFHVTLMRCEAELSVLNGTHFGENVLLDFVQFTYNTAMRITGLHHAPRIIAMA